MLEDNPSLEIHTIEGDVLTITKAQTAHKARDDFKTVNDKQVPLTDQEFLVKLHVESHIDEIAETSKKINKNGDNKNHSFAKDGFTYRKAYFEDFDGQYYEITLSIGHNGTVATVYNVGKIKESVISIDKIRDIDTITNYFNDCEYIEKSYLSDVDPSTGEATINLSAPSELYNQVLREIIDVDISSKAGLLKLFQDFQEAKCEYDQVKTALKTVKQTGYGIASPTLADMKLETPEIIKQGGRYGVKLKAKAPSIHMIKIDTETEVAPLVGSEKLLQDDLGLFLDYIKRKRVAVMVITPTFMKYLLLDKEFKQAAQYVVLLV